MRKLRISSISFRGEPTVQRARETLGRLVDRAALERPDVVVLPEISVQLGLRGEARVQAAEPVPGPTSDWLAAKAQAGGFHVVLPILHRDAGGAVTNSAFLISPAGDVVGRYDKMFPTPGELESGIRPGEKAEVFALPFGRVGMAICFDLNFCEVRDDLYAGDCEIVFFVSMYEGGLSLRVWAYEMGAWMVLSHAGGYSTFVDPIGRVIGRGDPGYAPIVTREINLDRKVIHLDENNAKLPALLERYGGKVEIDVIRPEAVFALESRIPGVTVADLCREFDLELRRDYFARARRLRAEAFQAVGV